MCALTPPFHTPQDILIYDEESDRHVRITFADALRASMAQPGDFGEYAAFPAAMQEKIDATGNGNVLDAVNRADKEALIAIVAAGQWVPVELVLARPFIEHLMMSAVLAVAGRDTGATLFGPADMQISANTSVKTIEGHYTCHTKSVITKPQNVYVMRDLMCSGYVAGGNTAFFGEAAAKENNGVYDPNDVNAAMNKRLTFQDDATGEYESMLAFAVPYGDAAKRDQVISLSPRLLPWEVTQREASWKSYFPGGRAGWDRYSQRIQLEAIHFGEDVRAAENMDFISQGVVNNALCFLGPHRVYNAFSTMDYELIPGQGHFGPDALPGDARWRRGESVSRESARNAMVGLEAAAHASMIFQRSS